MGAIQNLCGSDSKTLRERESAPSVFWKMKHETKNETLKSYVSFFEMTDIQLLYNKKWNMKDKSKVLKTYGYMFSRQATISRCSKYAAAAGYKRAPQLGR